MCNNNDNNNYNNINKFDHTNQWYMHNPEYILKNEMHKLLWDFEIQTDHLISARRPHLMIVRNNNNNKKKKKKNLVNWGLCHSGLPQNKTEREWKKI